MVMATVGAAFIGLSGIFVRKTSTEGCVTGFYRFFFALPFLFVWMFFEKRGKEEEGIKKQFDRKGWMIVLITGLAFAVDVALWNHSLSYTTVVNSSVFNNFTAFFVPLYMWAFFGERPKKTFLICGATGLLGSALLAGGGFDFHLTSLKGDLMAMLAATSYSVYIIGIKKLRGHFASSSIMLSTTVVSTVCIGTIAFIAKEPFWPLIEDDWLWLIGLAFFVHVLGQGLLAKSLSKVSASFAAIVLFIGPVVAGSIAWIFFNEKMGFIKILGAAIVLGSIGFVQLSEKRRDYSIFGSIFWRK